MLEIAKSIAVFCGSSEGISASYRKATEELGRRLAEKKLKVICGGVGIGLMGVLAKSVSENGGHVIGVLPEFLINTEPPSAFLSEIIYVETMAQRKTFMLESANDILILPGGFGSLNEAFEAITLKQLGMREGQNIFVSVDGFWKPLQDLVNHLEKQDFIILEGRSTLRFSQSVDETIALVTSNIET